MRQLSVLAAAAALALPPPEAPKVCSDCVLSDVQALTAPAFRGRECATPDEAAAAQFLAKRLAGAGAAAAAPEGGYIQTVALAGLAYRRPPELIVNHEHLAYGRDFLSAQLLTSRAGPLAALGPGGSTARALKGAFVLYDPPPGLAPMAAAALRNAGAAGILVTASQPVLQNWSVLSEGSPGRRLRALGPSRGDESQGAVIFLTPAASARLRAANPDGERLRLIVTTRPITEITRNVIGVVRGTEPDADARALLLSAHYDHLGVHGGEIFPGADDDASGSAVVLELARLFARGPPPRRSVFFALFGCEEAGGLGADFFSLRPPVRQLSNLSFGLELEMLGLPDPRAPNALTLTGWSRSDLGATLARLGARVEADPDPQDPNFSRSDNFALARRGVVAHSISAWAEPPSYHRPSDTAASLDPAFLSEAVRTLYGPLRRLASSDYQPKWSGGGPP